MTEQIAGVAATRGSGRIIMANRLPEGFSAYLRPTVRDVLSNYGRTLGKQWDRCERAEVEGGIPLAWERIEGVA